jgi:hypothetical protein
MGLSPKPLNNTNKSIICTLINVCCLKILKGFKIYCVCADYRWLDAKQIRNTGTIGMKRIFTSKMTVINARPENTGNFSCSVHSVTGETFTTLPGVEYIYVYGKIVFCPFFCFSTNYKKCVSS